MGRGKQWTRIETKALVEAYIHISEDGLIGVNQSGEQLYKRVWTEAKSRFRGDWMRSPEACKNRWLDVSREVQRFCAAMKFVTSVERSGWNDDDYFKAAEDYYRERRSVSRFNYVDEWKYLKSFEKWKTMTSPTTGTKRSSSSEDSELSDVSNT